MAQRVTWVAATVEAAVTSALDVTQVGLYIETEPISSNVTRVTAVIAYAEIIVDSDRVFVTAVDAYAEVEAGGANDVVRVTAADALAEVLVDTDEVFVTSIVAYAEVEGVDNEVRVTGVAAYAEILSVNNIVRATSVKAYAEVSPQSEILVTKVVADLETEDTGAMVSHFGVYVEYIGEGIYATQFGVLVEIEEVIVESMPTYYRPNSGVRHLHQMLPDERTGYALDPNESYWAVVIPEETINLVQQPSFEEDIDQYASSGFDTFNADDSPFCGTIAGTYAAACGYDGTISTLTYTFPDTLPANTYTFSCWIYAIFKTRLYLEIYDEDNLRVISHEFFVVPYTGWRRYDITGEVVGTVNLSLKMRVVADQTPQTVYTDAWQFEAKRYPTTYCDGDIIDFTGPLDEKPYYWYGVPHASISRRSSRTRSGGRIYDLRNNIEFRTTVISAMGAPPVETNKITMADGSERYVSTTPKNRTFTITGRIYGDDFVDLQRKKNRLFDVVGPFRTHKDEPALFMYQPSNAVGTPIAPPLQVFASYSGGLEGNITNHYQETIALQFAAAEPFFRNTVRYTKILQSATVYDLSNDAVFIFTRNREWEANGTPWGPDPSYIAQFASHPELGQIGFGGNFTQFGGSALLAYEAYYDSVNNIYARIGTSSDFLSDGEIMAMDSDNYRTDGSYYIGGSFTETASIDMRRIARINGTTHEYEELAPGFVNGGVFSVLSTARGEVWIVGSFTTDGDANPYGRVALYYIADYDLETWAWSALDGGFDAPVWDICQGQDGTIYICGDFFQDVTATTDFYYVAKWDRAAQEWVTMGGGLPDENSGHHIWTSKDGSIWVEAVHVGNGTSTTYKWNGSSWKRMFQFKGFIDDVAVDSNGDFHMVGRQIGDPVASEVNDWGHSAKYIITNGSVFRPGPVIELDVEAGLDATAVHVNELGEIAVAFENDDITFNVLVEGISTVDNGSSVPVPLTVFLSNGNPDDTVSYIYNATSNTGIYFSKNFEILPGETIVIDPRRVKTPVYSNLRADLTSYVLAGPSSIKNLALLPGANELHVMATCTVTVNYQLTHHGIDSFEPTRSFSWIERQRDE